MNYKAIHPATVLVASIALCCLPAHAESWTSQDKALHAIAGAAVGAAVTSATGEAWKGCAAAAAVGALKEVYDSGRPGHTVSAKDFVVTAAAGCLTSGLVVTPSGVWYSIKF